MVCEIGESKVHSTAGTYIKIGKQITYDLLSYFIFCKNMRNKIAVTRGIKFKMEYGRV